MECSLCHGARALRAATPSHFEVFVADKFDRAPDDDGVRTYPCPACEKTPPYELLQIKTVSSETRADQMDVDRYIRRDHALKIGDAMREAGSIIMEKRTTDGRTEHRSIAAVISPVYVASLGKRLEEHHTDFAKEVADLAIASIYSWGSHYGETHILKEMASRFIREAIKAAVARRKEWTQ